MRRSNGALNHAGFFRQNYSCDEGSYNFVTRRAICDPRREHLIVFVNFKIIKVDLSLKVDSEIPIKN